MSHPAWGEWIEMTLSGDDTPEWAVSPRMG